MAIGPVKDNFLDKNHFTSQSHYLKPCSIKTGPPIIIASSPTKKCVKLLSVHDNDRCE